MRTRSSGVTSKQLPRFITVEGIEGSGKSTLVTALVTELEKRGYDIVATREPGGTPLGDRVRTIFKEPHFSIAPMTEAYLVNASRAQLIAEVVAPNLAAGKIVVSDRFTDATLAYQGGGRGMDIAVLASLNRIATGGLMPDRTLLVDVPVACSRARVRARAVELGIEIDRLENEDTRFHERVRAAYLALAQSEPRITVLSGEVSPDALLAAALNALFT